MKIHSGEINLLTGAIAREYDYRSSFPKEMVNEMTKNEMQVGAGPGSIAAAALKAATPPTAGPKHVPGRSLKETATAIRKQLIRETGALAGVAVEIRREGGRQLLCTFTHHSARKVPVDKAWLESEAGKAARAQLELVLADYRDGAPEPKGPEDPRPFGWTIAEPVT